MDTTFQLPGQAFVWDSEKAAAKLRKHRVSFEQACEVLLENSAGILISLQGIEMRACFLGLPCFAFFALQ